MFPYNDTDINEQNLAIQAFGKRVYADQTLYEYLLEFLLVFVSPKEEHDDSTKYIFHSNINGEQLKYYTDPRIGLKRFIFFDKSKLENRYKIDELAYNEIVNIISKNIESDEFSKKDIITVLQDLFYGFSAVIRNRAWFAQSLLPIVPELIFSESMGDKKARTDRDIENSEDFNIIDREFEWNRHSFMARGGEVYYLHVLQGLLDYPEYREPIENGLKEMVTSIEEFSQLADFIQNLWENKKGINKKLRENTCGYIPEGYRRRSKYTCIELKNFLSCDMSALKKIELLTKGIMLQIIRMIHEQACEVTKSGLGDAKWIIDFRGRDSNPNIRKLSAESYKKCEEDISNAISHYLVNIDSMNEFYIKRNKAPKTDVYFLKEARKHTVDLVRKLGKEIKLVIPPTSGYTRFSLSEDLLKFLVLSIIPPKQKYTLDSFLELLYEHFGLVIGPVEMENYCISNNVDFNNIAYFDKNRMAFQEMLKNCGLLRDLSDATSIVENPYNER